MSTPDQPPVVAAASSPAPAIECIGLTKQFKDQLAVSQVSFRVPYSAVTGFVGANGSGKTTTMRMVMGLINPTSGSAMVDGRPYAELATPRLKIGAALNRLGAHPGHSARQHLSSIARASRISGERVKAVLEIVELDLAADRRVGTYSTGMSQRLALAVALLGEPDILLLDEPANGLDPGGIRWLRQFLRRSADTGAAVFVSTHQLAELETIVDHLVVLDNGHVINHSSTQQLLALTRTDRLEDAVLALTDPTRTAGEPTR